MAPIRVLVVDDSAFMRHSVARVLGAAEDIDVVGTAADGEQGLRATSELRPDVITLDVEMPVLDGLGMLRRLMVEQPTRVVMLSSLTTDGAAVTLDALDLGAIDFAAKPSGSLSIDLARIADELLAKVRAAASVSDTGFLRHRAMALARIRRDAGSRPGGLLGAPGAASSSAASLRAGGAPEATAARGPVVRARRLVVIASSTGGPGTLSTLFADLPRPLGAGVLVVQHMPAGFTASLAQRLAGVGQLPVSEATSSDTVTDDRALLAAGGSHLVAASSGRVQLLGLPAVNGVRPAADVTLNAVAPIWRERLLAVVLTGMGADGCQGARSVKAHGGTVYAQDEATSVVYGMPAAVAEAGLVDRVVSLPRMADAIARWARADAEPLRQAG